MNKHNTFFIFIQKIILIKSKNNHILIQRIIVASFLKNTYAMSNLTKQVNFHTCVYVLTCFNEHGSMIVIFICVQVLKLSKKIQNAIFNHFYLCI